MRRVDSGRELKQALSAAGTAAQQITEEILQKVSIDAFRELVIRSAADTGYLRSNWAMVVDKPGPQRIKNSGKEGGYYRDAAYPNKPINYNSIITFYNNTEYAIYLETGTPYMRAQPMVEPTAMYVNGVLGLLAKKASNNRLNI